MLPTLRQLLYLKLVAEYQSFNKAAEAAFVSQPALSTGIAELEKILGTRLIDRARGQVILTAAGEEILQKATSLLADAEDLVACARALVQPLSGRFRLGLIPTIAPFMLPSLYHRISQDFPNLKLFLREDQTSRLIAGLKNGTLDAAIIALPYDLSGLDHLILFDDPIKVVLPKAHALSQCEAISPQQLNLDELILLEEGHCLRDHALLACHLSSQTSLGALTPTYTEGGFAATSLTTLLQMIDAGLGVSLITDMAIKAGILTPLRVVTRPLISDQSRRDIAIVWRAGSSRALEAKLLAKSIRPLD